MPTMVFAGLVTLKFYFLLYCLLFVAEKIFKGSENFTANLVNFRFVIKRNGTALTPKRTVIPVLPQNVGFSWH